jgi:hypothetical protein
MAHENLHHMHDTIVGDAAIISLAASATLNSD